MPAALFLVIASLQHPAMPLLLGAAPFNPGVPRGPVAEAPLVGDLGLPAAAAPPVPAPAPASGAARSVPRPRAVEYSDFYYFRLTVHRIASYATIPLFVTEYALGQSLYSNPPGSRATVQAHQLVAAGVYGLFGLNTATGLWNLWDSRHDPNDRTRRYVHATLMLLSDAGFVWAGSIAPGRRRVLAEPSRMREHRTVAEVSFSTALAGYLMMLVWKH